MKYYEITTVTKTYVEAESIDKANEKYAKDDIIFSKTEVTGIREVSTVELGKTLME